MVNAAVALCLALLGGALAADAAPVAQAFLKGSGMVARGAVISSVYFPPRATPDRALNALPQINVYGGLLRRNFEMTVAGTELIAGRPTSRYDLTPRAGNAGAWSVWVDQQWRVPLAFEERSRNGPVSRRAAFISVTGVVTRPAPLGPPVRTPGLRGALLGAFPGLNLPAGFEPTEAVLTSRGTEVRLSDGLNALVIVITDRNVKAAPGVASRRFGRTYLWVTGNFSSGDLNAVLSGVRRAAPEVLGTFLAAAPSK